MRELIHLSKFRIVQEKRPLRRGIAIEFDGMVTEE